MYVRKCEGITDDEMVIEYEYMISKMFICLFVDPKDMFTSTWQIWMKIYFLCTQDLGRV